jgi:MSHA pilin protein MshD
MLMLINKKKCSSTHLRGISLIELLVFIVVVSIALIALVEVYRQVTLRNADPMIRVRALEATQSLLDEILSLKYDGATPTGGIPACDTTSAPVCNNTPDADMNDVDDYHNFNDQPYAGYNRSVTVTTNTNIKLIQVSTSTPTGETIVLAAQRANF